MGITIALVGRSNVGKSTLFNRLVGKKIALTHNKPGVTRDWRESQAEIGGLDCIIVDTAGLEETMPDTLEARLSTQTWKVIANAHIVLILVDAQTGVTLFDQHLANILRRREKPTILVINKCEGLQFGLPEAYNLGLGDPVCLSAIHGDGLIYLEEVLLSIFNDQEWSFDKEKKSSYPAVTLTVIGRPNVGKSTLINYLLREERMVTGPEENITRDAITTEWTWHGRSLQLIDTAGIHRRTIDVLERMAVASTMVAIDHAQIVILLLDATRDFLEQQDITIARTVIKKGCPLIVAVNKWDTVFEGTITHEVLNKQLEKTIPQIPSLPLVLISAKTGDGVEKLLRRAFEVETLWNKRLSTASLNRWMKKTEEYHRPPSVHRFGKHVKLRYITQIAVRPPTFVLFTNYPDDIPASYLRYLVNSLRQHFLLPSIPIRLYLHRNRTQGLMGFR